MGEYGKKRDVTGLFMEPLGKGIYCHIQKDFKGKKREKWIASSLLQMTEKDPEDTVIKKD